MELMPQKHRSSPRYPARLLGLGQRAARKAATALLASAALVVVACGGSMPNPVEPTYPDARGDADVEPDETPQEESQQGAPAPPILPEPEPTEQQDEEGVTAPDKKGGS